jgi:hypothetical protein
MKYMVADLEAIFRTSRTIVLTGRVYHGYPHRHPTALHSNGSLFYLIRSYTVAFLSNCT